MVREDAYFMSGRFIHFLGAATVEVWPFFLLLTETQKQSKSDHQMTLSVLYVDLENQ